MRTYADIEKPAQGTSTTVAPTLRAAPPHRHADRPTLDMTTHGGVAHDFNRVPVERREDPGGPPVRAWTAVERYPFRAAVRRAPATVGESARTDGPPGLDPDDADYLSVFRQLSEVPGTASGGALSGQAGEAVGEEGTGTPIRLPDIQNPALAALGRTDAVNAAFTYSGSITRGGAAPAGFGVTRSFDSKLTGVVITPNPGTFDVAATFEHPITYQIRSGTGPNGQVDIASETDGDITKSNYPTVVSNLTPNMGDLNGRPPRTAFWAEDLTERHELVHAHDDNTNGPGAMATATAWLNSQIAASVADVTTHLGAVPGRFATALLAALSTVDGERHAYGDGAPAYKARADAIKAKGDKGEYPDRGSTLGAVLGGAGGLLLGGAAGAGLGFLAGGPLGALIGGVIGGIAGLIGGIFAGRSL